MAKAPINLRGEESLKDKLQDIAKDKDTSLNEVAIHALESYVQHYFTEKVEDDAIPSREKLIADLETVRSKLKSSYRNIVKYQLADMISSASEHTVIHFSQMDNVEKSTHLQICKEMQEELNSLGYLTFMFDSDMPQHYSDICNYYYKTGDVAVSLSKEHIDDYISDYAAMTASADDNPW